MGFKDITDGDKIAKPIAARIVKSKTGTLGIEVAFEFEEPQTGGIERLNWTGWLTKDAIDRTMETLVKVLGYNGSKTTSADGTLTDPNVLDFENEVKLVVEHEINPNNQKSYPKIKWVNSMGGSAYVGVGPQTVKADLESLGFDAAFQMAKASVKQSGEGNGAEKKELNKQTPPPAQKKEGGLRSKMPF